MPERGYFMKKLLVSAVLLVAVCTALAFSACLYPSSLHKIDYESMELVFEDDFDTFDTSVWHSEDDGVRRGGYWDINQVKAEDGNLVITTEYKEDGTFGAGWYTGSVYTRDTYALQAKDGAAYYAEVRCILSPGQGQWAAFWLQSGDMNESGAGTEIDVVEGAHYDDPAKPSRYKNTAFHTIHFGGYGDKHESKQSAYYEVGNDIYKNFNTYGVYWDNSVYRFYINGMLTWETSFHPTGAGEYLRLTVEIAGENGYPSNPNNSITWSGGIEKNEGGREFSSQFVIDYVKCYKVK